MSGTEWVIEELTKKHKCKAFSGGDPELDRFIQLPFSIRNAKQNTARTFVLADAETNRVVGYYSVSATSLDGSALSDEERRGKPRILPAILIGRLAVGTGEQGSGFGMRLLFDALNRARLANRQAAAYCVVIDAINEAARAFYARYGFKEPRRPAAASVSTDDDDRRNILGFGSSVMRKKF